MSEELRLDERYLERPTGFRRVLASWELARSAKVDLRDLAE